MNVADLALFAYFINPIQGNLESPHDEQCGRRQRSALQIGLVGWDSSPDSLLLVSDALPTELSSVPCMLWQRVFRIFSEFFFCLRIGPLCIRFGGHCPRKTMVATVPFGLSWCDGIRPHQQMHSAGSNPETLFSEFDVLPTELPGLLLRWKGLFERESLS